MANSECRWQCPEQWSEWSEWLAAGLHARSRWRLPLLLIGILFAGGRRTVTTWLRAAGVSDDFQDYYYFLAALGRKTNSVATRLTGAGTGLLGCGAANDSDGGFDEEAINWRITWVICDLYQGIYHEHGRSKSRSGSVA